MTVRFLAATAFICAVSGCVGPDWKIPDSPDIGKFTADTLPKTETAQGKTLHLDVGRDLPAAWWTLFRSHQLNALIERSLKDNPNLESAQAALRVAQANVYAEVGALLPLAQGNYQAQGGKIATTPSTNFSGGVAAPIIGAGGVNPSYYSLHTAQFTVSYVPDVWGGTRRQIENLESLKENQRFQNEATFLTLTSNIASGAVQEASYRAQIQVTERLITISKDILGKVRLQHDLGQVSELDVAAQEALLAQTEATLPPLLKSLALARDQLIVLSGHLPGDGLKERFEFTSLKLPARLPVSIASNLVEQRPDIRAAEASLHASLALVGVAIANRLPQFSITGAIGHEGALFQNLFSNNPAFYFYTGIANATQTIFDGFTLQQRQRAAEAGVDQAAAQYRLTVLTGYQNVADALYSIKHDTVALQKAILAEQAAAKTLRLTRLQLEQGQVAYLQLLGAQTTYLQASLAVVQQQANRYADTVALFQALGGGWWNKDAPPHVPEPDAWLTSVTTGRDPIGVEYPGATQNEARCKTCPEVVK